MVYAMSRGTPEHGLLTSSMTIALGNALPPGCRVYSGDTMLYVEHAPRCTYAELGIVCGERETLHGARLDVDAMYGEGWSPRAQP